MIRSTLYLKYRPQTINELDSQKVRDQFTSLVSSGRLPHAFLFSGPKGTGKTSAARILAKIINCEKFNLKKGEPCNKCLQCMGVANGNNFDVIEMDAASNRGIDDIRQLKEKIMLSPGSAKKKVYIIDEVHMLTPESFNALLKTLEEPPDHVIFILATTDPERLPDTIRSRLTNIVFEKAKEDEVVRQLKRAAKGENLNISDDILKMIAKVSEGAFRDSVKTLEEIIINLKKIDEKSVENFLFQTRLLNVKDLLKVVIQKETKKAISLIEKFSDQGGNIKKLINDMLFSLHNSLLSNLGFGGEKVFEISQKDLENLVNLLQNARNEIINTPVAQLPLEIAVVRFCGKVEAGKGENGDEKKTEGKTSQESLADMPVSQSVSSDSWLTILNLVRAKSPSVEGLLRAAKPLSLNDSQVTIGVYYRFHKEQLENKGNKKILQDILSQVLGGNFRVEFILTEKSVTKDIPQSLTQVESVDILEAAKEIFGE